MTTFFIYVKFLWCDMEVIRRYYIYICIIYGGISAFIDLFISFRPSSHACHECWESSPTHHVYDGVVHIGEFTLSEKKENGVLTTKPLYVLNFGHVKCNPEWCIYQGHIVHFMDDS